MRSPINPTQLQIFSTVKTALEEDIGTGDVTAQLISAATLASAKIISREAAILCGQAWANETARQVDSQISIQWLVNDGEALVANQQAAILQGPARSLLTAERTILNFLQTLSATATKTRELVDLVAHTSCVILDTRKTLPGLRLAQKYAVTVGGGTNHRLGLYDAYLIKENHIRACGGIDAAVQSAKQAGGNKPVEVEVQNLNELETAISAKADIVMLDNFSLALTGEAVALNAGRLKLEASGNVDRDTLIQIAETGVDYISIGALTKHCRAIDFSMLFNTAD
jgi:nicotinate-nucleotide pyrophosphorylase (carboxylating)